MLPSLLLCTDLLMRRVKNTTGARAGPACTSGRRTAVRPDRCRAAASWSSRPELTAQPLQRLKDERFLWISPRLRLIAASEKKHNCVLTQLAGVKQGRLAAPALAGASRESAARSRGGAQQQPRKRKKHEKLRRCKVKSIQRGSSLPLASLRRRPPAIRRH